MATYYVDPEAGNDANDGLSFANRWKTLTLGATAARIAPGDTIRVIASPSPTSIGNVAWRNKTRVNALPATINISSVTAATPIKVTTAVNHGLSTGDVIQIQSATGTQAYLNGNWVVTVIDTDEFTLDGSVSTGSTTGSGNIRAYNTRSLKMTTAVTKKIDMCEVAWTLSANVSGGTSSSGRKQGDACANLAIASGFTTGKVAYRTLPATLDLSAYQQVSLWIRANNNFASGVFTIRLCSDATGDTTVDTLTVPACSTANAFFPITMDKGSALGSAIASIALYADTDPGTVTVQLDCIIAVKAPSANDSLGLQSLIGKNTSDDTFYPIASIEDQVICLDSGAGWTASSVSAGYYGIEETVESYKLEPLKLEEASLGDLGLSFTDSGSSGNLITYSGGWNRTDMSTQTGMSWHDCRNGVRNVFNWTTRSFLNISKFGIVRASTVGGGFDTNDCLISDFHSNGNDVGIAGAFRRGTWSGSIFVCNNNQFGILFSGQNVINTDMVFGDSIKKANSNGDRGLSSAWSGITIQGMCRASFGVIGQLCGNGGNEGFGQISFIQGSSSRITIEEIQKIDSCRYGLYPGGNEVVIKKVTFASGVQTALMAIAGGTTRIYEASSAGTNLIESSNVNFNVSSGATIKARRWTSSDSTVNAMSGNSATKLSVDAWGGTADDHRVFMFGCNVQSEGSVRHTASGIAWRFAITSTAIGSVWPAELPVAHVYCEANKQVTVKAWLRRSHTDHNIGICVKKDQLTGIGTTQTSYISAAVDTWQEVTIQFTPTEKGVIEVLAVAYGGVGHFGYIDDLTIQQAA